MDELHVFFFIGFRSEKASSYKVNLYKVNEEQKRRFHLSFCTLVKSVISQDHHGNIAAKTQQ